VGNKCDLEKNRQIKLADAESYARNLSLLHYSASARTGANVQEIFSNLTERKLPSFEILC
jgi:hypothetical protein